MSSRTLVPVEAPLIFEEAAELEHPIILLEPLAFLLNRLLEQLCARLASRALATQELRLTLDLDNLTGIDQEFENPGIPSESDGVGSSDGIKVREIICGDSRPRLSGGAKLRCLAAGTKNSSAP